ncbi:MAG: GPP34 family phosphoprotein [Candidatus Cloacimonetes bacterium]|nr:GPP34 family phosphoprotein [Candidatus Cloacimonadota bacterium]
MLNFAEEFLLLALDDEKGYIINMPLMSLEYGLTGAILMDLALMNKIDTDLKNLILVDDSPTGDEIFDNAIDMIRKYPDSKDAKYWVREIGKQFENLKDSLIERLVEKGILKKVEKKILWVFSKRRYPIIDNKEEKEVKTRIRKTILNNDIPDPRDIVLISLIKTCNMIDEIFTSEEKKVVKERIDQIAKMDLIGQAVSNAVNEIQRMVTSAVASVMVRPMP